MQKPGYDSVAYGVVGARLFYVLSIGPVARLCEAGYLPTPICKRIYTPLVAVARTPVVRPVLIAYVNAWGAH